MPALYTLLSLINDNINNEIIILVMINSYLILNSFFLNKRKAKEFCLFNLILFFYIVYISIIHSPKEIIDNNFYSYIFMFIMFILFSEYEIRKSFLSYFSMNKHRFIFYTYIFLICILISVVGGKGLKMTESSSIPVLYGPFEIPHILAYIVLVIYCGLSLCGLNKKSNKIYCLKGIAIIIVVFTAVRTGFLALLILLAVEYLSVKGVGKKIIIFFFIGLAFVFLIFNTDLFLNNPIVQKTIYAMKAGSITNGRETYREVAMNYYINNCNTTEKIFGVGIKGVIDAIYSVLRVRIHAHNDYVNILVGYGVLGFIIMIYCQLKLCKISKSIWNILLFQAFVFALAYFNGFAMYIMITASFPIIICFFEVKMINKKITI